MGDDNKIHHEYERVVVSAEGATAGGIRIYGSGAACSLRAGRLPTTPVRLPGLATPQP
jgi:hypothetical protein